MCMLFSYYTDGIRYVCIVMNRFVISSYTKPNTPRSIQMSVCCGTSDKKYKIVCTGTTFLTSVKRNMGILLVVDMNEISARVDNAVTRINYILTGGP